MSIACNVSKFMELKVHYPDVVLETGHQTNNSSASREDLTYYVDVTDFRRNPQYMVFSSVIRYMQPV